MVWNALRRHFDDALLGVILLGCGLVVFELGGGEDLLRAYPSPERHRGVDVRVVPESELPPQPEPAENEGDFDGDGVADEFFVDYYHMEPLFDRSTSGLLYVWSGRTDRVLLAHAVATPMSTVYWCDDRDGNGKDELVVEDEWRWFVIGRR